MRIDFPPDELDALRELLAEGHSIFTARILSERGKYNAGQVLDSVLGRLRVLSVTWMKPGDHPFRDQLTCTQRTELNGHEGDMLKLISAGST